MSTEEFTYDRYQVGHLVDGKRFVATGLEHDSLDTAQRNANEIVTQHRAALHRAGLPDVVLTPAVQAIKVTCIVTTVDEPIVVAEAAPDEVK